MSISKMKDGVEEDIWWYVCTVCNQAFIQESGFRSHKSQAHGSIRSASVLILSQNGDLAPNIELTHCWSSPITPATREWSESFGGLDKQDQDPIPNNSLRIVNEDRLRQQLPVIRLTQCKRGRGESRPRRPPTEVPVKIEVSEASKHIESCQPADVHDEVDFNCQHCSSIYLIAVQLKKHVLLMHTPDPTENEVRDATSETEDKKTVFEEIATDDLLVGQGSSSSDESGSDTTEVKVEPIDEDDMKAGTGSRSRLRPRKIPMSTAVEESSQDDSDWDYDQEVVGSDEDAEGKRKPKREQRTRRRSNYNGHAARRRPLDMQYKKCKWFQDLKSSAKLPPYRCELCLKLFSNLFALERHLYWKHEEHLRNLKEGVPCSCSICFMEEFLQPAKLNVSADLHPLILIWECKICEDAVAERVIKSHINREHPDHNLPLNIKTNGPPSAWRIAKERELPISNVRLRASTTTNESRTKNAERLGQEENEESNRRSSAGGRLKSLKCPMCHKEFRYYRLKSHLVNMHNSNMGRQKQNKCPKCPKAFPSCKMMKQHVMSSHAMSRDRLCPICGLGFRTQSQLTGHHYRLHSGEVPYTCDCCGVGFKYKSALARHAVRHIQERSIRCPQCPKTFQSAHHVKSHVDYVHLGKKKKMDFKCKLCVEPKQFPGLVSLRRHELEVHNFQAREGDCYKCKYCDKKFARLFNLEQHEPTHTDDRKFICETCGKGFKLVSNLRQHKFSHLSYDELPQVCNIEDCGKRFGVPAQLRSHKKRIHEKLLTKDKCNNGEENEDLDP